ncbi:MAG: hypothetical protein N4A71_23205 [Carboxylicivirga sp.]|jgi:hypothetical protein|nr:hypothetical protein [Carboxylicivirga sp.]
MLRKLTSIFIIAQILLACGKDEAKDEHKNYNCKDRFYYYASEKIYFSELPNQGIISFYDALAEEDIHQLIKQYEVINLIEIRSKGRHAIISIKSDDCSLTNNLFSIIKKEAKVSNCQKYLVNGESKWMGIYDTFVCQLKSGTTQSQVAELILETNTEVLEASNVHYTIRADKNSQGDALDMANKFFESDYFEFAEPVFISDWAH